MLRGLSRNAAEDARECICEGDLYKRIEYGGRTFELRYGYYEECDRHNPLVGPVPIYPDFVANPVYDREGRPFVTDMQDACAHYKGTSPEDGCYSCCNHQSGSEFLGICLCEANRKNE